MHVFTKEQAEFIKDNAPGTGNTELRDLFNNRFNLNLTLEQIKAYKKNHNISSGLDGRFPPGHVPFNKGKKKYWKGGEETQFKKGHTPKNHRHVGSERIDSKDGYLLVKVSEPNKWQLKHRVIWEEHNGKIPKGYNVIFGDGDITNFDIDNLILVSRRQLLILNKNKLIQKDADLTRTAVIIADLHQKISESSKRG